VTDQAGVQVSGATTGDLDDDEGGGLIIWWVPFSFLIFGLDSVMCLGVTAALVNA